MVDAQSLDSLYLFKIFGRRLLIDRPSGFPRRVSDCAWELLCNSRLDEQQHEARNFFSEVELAEAREELEEKTRFGMLACSSSALSDDLKPSGVFSALINLTHHCNMACRYCLMGLESLEEGYRGSEEVMTELTAIRTLEFLHNVGVSSPISLTFFGGEPLLEFRLMEKVVSHAETHYPKRFLFSIITNGTLLTDEIINFIKEHQIGLVFSIDGNRASNDSLRVFKSGKESVFEKAFGNLEQLKKRVPDAKYKVNVTYFKQTLNLAESFRFFLDQGITQTRYERGLTDENSPYAIDASEIKIVKEQFSEMAKIYRDFLVDGNFHMQDNFLIFMSKLSNGIQRYHGCNMGIDYVTIASNGDVYPCHKLIGLSGAGIGNIASGLENSRYDQLWSRSVLSRAVCEKCWARFVCGGGCSSDNYHYNNDFLKPVAKSCEIIKHLIKLSCWLLAELEDQAPAMLKRLLGADYLSENDTMQRCDDWLNYEKGEKHLRNLKTSGEYRLNETAMEIFDACDGQNNIRDIVRKQMALYGIPKDVALQDVKDILFRMGRNGLVSFSGVDNQQNRAEEGC